MIKNIPLSILFFFILFFSQHILKQTRLKFPRSLFENSFAAQRSSESTFEAPPERQSLSVGWRPRSQWVGGRQKEK